MMNEPRADDRTNVVHLADYTSQTIVEAVAVLRTGSSLKSGDGGGTSDGMERRVTKIEDKLDKLTEKVGGVEVQLATLTERIAHLPGKGFVVTSAIATVTAMAALITFGEKLQALIR